MRNAHTDTRPSGSLPADAGPLGRSEIMDMLAEAGLGHGQGQGIEWVVDRLTARPEVVR